MPDCVQEMMVLPTIRARVARARSTPRLPQPTIRQPITSTSFGFNTPSLPGRGPMIRIPAR